MAGSFSLEGEVIVQAKETDEGVCRGRTKPHQKKAFGSYSFFLSGTKTSWLRVERSSWGHRNPSMRSRAHTLKMVGQREPGTLVALSTN